MATMSGISADQQHELTWTDGTWSGDERAARLATAESTSGDTIDIIPFGEEIPLADPSAEVVGFIIRWTLNALYGGHVEITYADGMTSRSAVPDYDGTERVY